MTDSDSETPDTLYYVREVNVTNNDITIQPPRADKDDLGLGEPMTFDTKTVAIEVPVDRTRVAEEFRGQEVRISLFGEKQWVPASHCHATPPVDAPTFPGFATSVYGSIDDIRDELTEESDD